MNITLTRRHFIAAVPLSSASLMAACSPKAESTPVAAEQMPATPTPPAPVPAPAPTAAPASGPMAALPMLDEADTQAKSLGYVADAARADRTRFPTIVAGSRCGSCAMFRGAAGDASGPCQLYPGRAVSATGWCSAWAKKA